MLEILLSIKSNILNKLHLLLLNINDIPSIFLSYLVVGFVMAIAYSTFFECYLHERMHYQAIKHIALKTTNFNKKPTQEITINRGISAYINSDFYDFLATNPAMYSKQIKSIARAGALYTSFIYIIIVVVSIICTLYLSIFFSAILTFSITTLLITLMKHFFDYKEKYNEEGVLIGQPDRFLVKHPEQFKNVHRRVHK